MNSSPGLTTSAQSAFTKPTQGMSLIQKLNAAASTVRTEIDLTQSRPSSQPTSTSQAPTVVGAKRPTPSLSTVSPSHTALATAISAPINALSAPKRQRKADLKPHVLIWVCHWGTANQSHKWTNKNLKIVGVYGSKEEAENKKLKVMEEHNCGGHGDICVGGYVTDEIDLVVRPVEECTLGL